MDTCSSIWWIVLMRYNTIFNIAICDITVLWRYEIRKCHVAYIMIIQYKKDIKYSNIEWESSRKTTQLQKIQGLLHHGENKNNNGLQITSHEVISSFIVKIYVIYNLYFSCCALYVFITSRCSTLSGA